MIAAGVSINIGVQGIVVEALNRNYRAIVASDCVAGFPPEYAEMSLKHGVGIVARVTTARDIAAAWGIDLGRAVSAARLPANRGEARSVP